MSSTDQITVPESYWRDDLDDRPVMVSIHCITYNHEKFIRDALEGFVKQQTNFRFEAIVHDDASTDGTAAIIREYADKYPSIIKPILETENQYQKRSLGKIMNAHIRGKYVAICEGDDFWIDPLKLQKQVDFLESHPEFTLCFHRCKWIYDDNNEGENHLSEEITKYEYTSDELIRTWYCSSASMVYRKSVKDTDDYKRLFTNPKIITGDLPLQALLGHLGKLHGINEVMSVYRKHEGGISNQLSKIQRQICEQYVEIKHIFGRKVYPSLNYHIGNSASFAIWLIRSGKLKEGAYLWCYVLWHSPKQSLKSSFWRIFNFIKKKVDR